MTTFKYNVIIQDSEPTAPPLWIWISPIISAAYLRLKGAWIPVAGGNPFTATNGIFFRQSLDQTAEPTSPDVGDKWINDNNQCLIYLDDWRSVVGG